MPLFLVDFLTCHLFPNLVYIYPCHLMRIGFRMDEDMEANQDRPQTEIHKNRLKDSNVILRLKDYHWKP